MANQKHIFLISLAVVILAGLSYFYFNQKHNDTDWYCHQYYLWDKLKDLCFGAVICYLLHLTQKRQDKVLMYIFDAITAFFALRFAFELFGLKDYDAINDEGNLRKIFSVFICVIFGVVYRLGLRKHIKKARLEILKKWKNLGSKK